MATARGLLKKGLPANLADEDAQGAHPKETFWVGSPLLQGKLKKFRETCYENLAPFWAIPMTPNETDQNMVLETMSFEVPGFTPTAGSKFPSLAKGAKFIVDIEIMRNSKTVTKDEALFLAWRGD